MSNPTQLPALPQGATGAPLVLAVNDRLRRIAQSTATTTDAAATAQTAADAAQASADAAAKTADGALQAASNLSDVPNKTTALLNIGAVTRTTLTFAYGSASATYSQAEMTAVINAINQILVALQG
jgi:hypothetical protein